MLTLPGLSVPGRGESGALVAPDFPLVKGIPQLAQECRARDDAGRFGQWVRRLECEPTALLLIMLTTQADPLRLWALHLQLERRSVPPCLRWPPRVDCEQFEYLSALADLRWICSRLPSRKPKFRGWRGVFTHRAGSPAWHAVAHRQFNWITCRGYSLAHHWSKGLGLEDAERRDLLMLPTTAMAAERRQLIGMGASAMHERLLSDAIAHPDKSGQRSAADVAGRRATIWRTYVLSGRAKTLTVERLALICDIRMSRQALNKQLEAIQRALSG